MHEADIKAAIKKAGSSQTKIAAELSVSITAVYLIIKGASHSKSIADKISEITGYSVEELWPGQYPEEAA